MTGFGDETSPAAQIARDMRVLDKETRKQVRPILRQGGERVAATTRANASWSTRIPGTVRVVVSFRQDRESVKVKAGGPSTPHARPNEDIDGDRHLFHPVWGHPWFVVQLARPFLFPAAEQHQSTDLALVAGTLNAAATVAGFK